MFDHIVLHFSKHYHSLIHRSLQSNVQCIQAMQGVFLSLSWHPDKMVGVDPASFGFIWGALFGRRGRVFPAGNNLLLKLALVCAT